MGFRNVCILIFSVVVGVLLQARVGPQPIPPDIPPSKADAIFSIQPGGLQTKPGYTFSVQVFIDPRKSDVSGAELEVAYNPEILQIQSTKPGDFLGKDVHVEKGYPKIDNINGLMRLKASSGKPMESPVTPGVFYEFTISTSAQLSAKWEEITIIKAVLIKSSGEKIKNVARVPGSVQARFFENERIRLDPITQMPR
jgi:hypothetical protein